MLILVLITNEILIFLAFKGAPLRDFCFWLNISVKQGGEVNSVPN